MKTIEEVLQEIKENPIQFCEDMIQKLQEKGGHWTCLCECLDVVIAEKLGADHVLLNSEFEAAFIVMKGIGITREKVQELTPDLADYTRSGYWFDEWNNSAPRIVFLQKFIEQLRNNEKSV